MTDLSTRYMGLELRNPILVSSSDLVKSVEGIQKCADAGAGAVILKSIFEEQFLVQGEVPEEGHFVHPEVLDYMRAGHLLEYAPQKVCAVIEEAKKNVDIPVIASINCLTAHLWPSFAKQLTAAGADALELNIYIQPLDLEEPAVDYETKHIEILKSVKKEVSVPVSVKLATQFTSLPFFSNKLSEAGAEALVLFNWFLDTDIDTSARKTRNIKGKGHFYQTLRWTALLAGRIDCDLSSSGGIEEADDIVKLLLAGADAVQACSVFYEKGLDEIGNLLAGLRSWMEANNFSSLGEFRGELAYQKQTLSFKDSGQAQAYFRGQYLKTYSK